MCERQVGWMHLGKEWREMYSRRRESSSSTITRSNISVNGWTCFMHLLRALSNSSIVPDKEKTYKVARQTGSHNTS